MLKVEETEQNRPQIWVISHYDLARLLFLQERAGWTLRWVVQTGHFMLYRFGLCNFYWTPRAFYRRPLILIGDPNLFILEDLPIFIGGPQAFYRRPPNFYWRSQAFYRSPLSFSWKILRFVSVSVLRWKAWWSLSKTLF